MHTEGMHAGQGVRGSGRMARGIGGGGGGGGGREVVDAQQVVPRRGLNCLWTWKASLATVESRGTAMKDEVWGWQRTKSGLLLREEQVAAANTAIMEMLINGDLYAGKVLRSIQSAFWALPGFLDLVNTF